MKKGKDFRVWAAIVALAGIPGCGVIELSPELPLIHASSQDGSETSELVIVISSDSLGYKAGWVVYVDGLARAWLPTNPSFTRIPVTPGTHEVTIAFRTRDLPIIIIPLLPSSNEVRAKRSLSCVEHARCAIKAGIHIDRKTNYLVVDEEVIEKADFDNEIQSLNYVAPGE